MIKAHIYGYNEAVAGKTNVHCYLAAVPKAGDAYFDAEGEFQILAVGYEAGKENIRVYIKKDLPEAPPKNPVWDEAAANQKAKRKWYQFGRK